MRFGLAFALLAALLSAVLLRTQRLPATVPPVALQPRPLPSGVAFAHVDSVSGGADDLPPGPAMRARRGEPVVVSGWAVDPATGIPPDEVVALVDGVPSGRAPLDRWRPMVAAALGDPLASTCGYRLVVAQLPPGVHEVRVVFRSGGAELHASNALRVEVGP